MNWQWVGASPEDRSPDGEFRREIAAIAREVMAAFGEDAGRGSGALVPTSLPDPEPGFFDVRSTLPFLLSLVKRALDQQLAVLGSSEADQVLLAVAWSPQATTTSLRRSLRLLPSSQSSVLSRLDREGFIAVERASEDRRVKVLGITERGLRQAERVAAVWRRVDDTILGILTPAEQEELRRLLRRLAGTLATRRGSP